MSSSSAVVPERRLPATVVKRPLRACHSAARRVGSLVKAAARTSGSPAHRPLVSASRAWSVPSSASCSSTSSAQCAATSRPAISSGQAGSRWATSRLRASSSSTVAGPAATISGRAPVAEARSSKTSSAVAACGRTGTVRKVASATKASVPSLPMTRCSRMRTGSSWSTKEFTP